jgi:hypothetical protein
MFYPHYILSVGLTSTTVRAGFRTSPWATTAGRPYAVDGIVGAGLRTRPLCAHPWATTAGRPYADQDHVP